MRKKSVVLSVAIIVTVAIKNRMLENLFIKNILTVSYLALSSNPIKITDIRLRISIPIKKLKMLFERIAKHIALPKIFKHA
jgi:hypothetical protein